MTLNSSSPGGQRRDCRPALFVKGQSRGCFQSEMVALNPCGFVLVRGVKICTGYINHVLVHY